MECLKNLEKSTSYDSLNTITDNILLELYTHYRNEISEIILNYTQIYDMGHCFEYDKTRTKIALIEKCLEKINYKDKDGIKKSLYERLEKIKKYYKK